MRCPSCQATIETTGVFPGARVACAGCGAEHVVAGAGSRRGSSPSIDTPYRAPGVRPPAAERAPKAARTDRGAGERPSGSACPRCAAPLEGPAGEGVLSCGDCGGVFVSHDELDAALEREKKTATFDPRAGAALAIDEVRYLPCPRCGDRMSRSLFGKRSGVVVDVCKMHGIWFDADELARAAHFLDEAGARKAPTAVRVPPPALTEEQVRARAEVEVLMRKESFDADRRQRSDAGYAGDWLSLVLDVLTFL
jgi:Zn-finger nucleic acid-binding protein